MPTTPLSFTIRHSDFHTLVVVNDGTEYTARFRDSEDGAQVVYSVDNEWAGVGTWTGSETIDCGANIPEAVLDALDAGLRQLDAG